MTLRVLGAALCVSVCALVLVVIEGAVRLMAPRAVMVPWQDDISGITAPKPDVAGRLPLGRLSIRPSPFTIGSEAAGRLRPSLCQGRRASPSSATARLSAGADDDETYPAVLEKELNGGAVAETSRAPVEVLNAGVIGTGTGEQALWYDVWVRRFRPSVVVLTVFWNDVDDDVRSAFFEGAIGSVRPRPYAVLEQGLSTVRRTRAIANRLPGFSWLSQHSQLLPWVRQAPTEFLMAAHARSVGAEAGTPPARSDRLTAESLALFQGEIRWLHERLTPSTRLAIVFLPSAESFDPTRVGHDVVLVKSAQIVSALRALSASAGVPFLVSEGGAAAAPTRGGQGAAL